MPEIGPEHPITYRQEIVTPLLRKLTGGESAMVIGPASMGKSRLITFLLREDVRAHYLGEATAATLFFWVDSNRMAEFTAWGLHELLLTVLVENCGQQAATSSLRQQLTEWRQQVILSQNSLLAQRYVELALQIFCQERGLHLYLILDEFDEPYRSLPPQALASLRALRDQHKYWLTYLLFLRHDPRDLRDLDQCEGFYELFSRSVFGLKPYGDEDARRVIDQVATRRQAELPSLSESVKGDLLRLSGRHPGLLVALMDALTSELPLGEGWEEWAKRQPTVWEECRKIWQGLQRRERETLHQLAINASTSFSQRASLRLKGLIDDTSPPNVHFFSPLLRDYAATRSPTANRGLRVDRQTGEVWVNATRCQSISGKEFELLAFLYDNLGAVCQPQAIIQHLYPNDKENPITENNIAALIARVRKKIEPNSTNPQYLKNVRGRGYQLVDEPEES
jgi:DNA-binding winged helix-turn-helix (wHTH) protein